MFDSNSFRIAMFLWLARGETGQKLVFLAPHEFERLHQRRRIKVFARLSNIRKEGRLT